MPEKDEEIKKKKAKESPQPEVHEEEEDGFGGIPARDFKKNLGCG